MTTITEDVTDPSAGTELPAAEEQSTRPRRFAPRRSRSSALKSPVAESSAGVESVIVLDSAPTADAALPGAPAQLNGATPEGVPADQNTLPTRSRRPRDRRPADGRARPAVETGAEPIIEEGGETAAAPVASVTQEAEPTLSGAAPESVETATPKPPARRAPARRRSRAASEPVAGRIVQISSEEETGEGRPTKTGPTRARRGGRTRPTSAAAAVEEPTVVDEAAATPPEAGIDLSALTEPVQIETAPVETAPQVTDEQRIEATPPATDEEHAPFGSDLADLFGLSSQEAAAVTADLEGGELLAKALREMFPPMGEAATPAAGVSPDDNLPEFDFEAAAAAFDALLDALPEADEDGEAGESHEVSGESEEAQRRRSRRGRRGGRGRRRGSLEMLPSPAAHEALATEPPAPPEDASAVMPAPTPSPEPSITKAPPLQAVPDAGARASEAQPRSPFVPENPPRAEAPWRDQRPRRNWGKVFPRDTARTEMPPPKPSSTRFMPIPQAAPPPPTFASAASVIASSTPFSMPDLRTEEPLAPGETRSERLLDVQTRLMAAMLEQQARQIDVLTASVGALYQAIQGLGGGANGARVNLPRTGIFVDAPNVVYAADNARVNIDYGRMLKYLSRDRQLVHALSYSPIIDDVREGIRYETQRFVAPFLRAGYKLITKPLKRFSDGSAKGNFDIELALDILTMAERLDIVVLVSGDSDFESVIEHIQSQGVRVEVVAFASNVSTELVNVADTFIDISQHLEHMRPL
jgi:uncharacterized LabA/DUF88 family protein